MTTQTEVDQLAALLDGTIGAGEVSPQLAALASLATRVTTTMPLATPSLAFREALRGELLQSVAGTAATTATAGATGAASTATATTSVGSQVAAWIAGLSASALLVSTGVVGLAPNAAPGDALYGAKLAIEQVQLRVADPAGRAELLLDLATRRVEEALGLTDALAIERVLDDSQRQLRDALALLGDLPLDVSTGLLSAQVSDHAAALEALRAQTSLLELTTRIDRLLGQTHMLVLTLGGTPEPGVGPTPGDTPTTPTPGATPPAGGATEPDEGETSPVTDPTDPTEDATDPVPDVTVPDGTGNLPDPLDDIVDDVTDTIGDVRGGTTAGVGELLRP